MALARSILPLTKQASSRRGLTQAAIRLLSSGSRAFCSSGSGILARPTALASSIWMRHSSRMVRWASSMAWIITSSEISLAPPSTMVIPSAVPATTMSREQRSSWS